MVSLLFVDIWEGVGVQSCVWMYICCWRYTDFKHFDFQLDNHHNHLDTMTSTLTTTTTSVTLWLPPWPPWLPPWPPPWWSGACWSGLSPTCATGSTLFSCQSTRSVQSACCQRDLPFSKLIFELCFRSSSCFVYMIFPFAMSMLHVFIFYSSRSRFLVTTIISIFWQKRAM